VFFHTNDTVELDGTRHACCREIFFLEVNMNAGIMLWGGGKRRSWEKETLLIAATAGIATAIGAAIGGKKGATFGAVSGGATRFLMRLLKW
jgi:hypothetical protein